MKKTVITFAVLAFLACGKSETPVTATNATSSSSSALTINGAGATFPNPIYSKWFSDYGKLHPHVGINYQPIGSGGGIRQLTAKTVFFGATDGPMSDEQLKAAPGPIVHLPTVLGGVVPIYNVPGITAPLHFTGETLANIYLGTIKKWNDPGIAKGNPGVKLPDSDIAVVHRSDGSGTTYIFVDFLSKVSPAFKTRVGVATSVSWPVGVGAKGNEGVSGLVKQTPGAIGYVELIYASHNNIPFGAVQNKSGKFVTASLDSVTAAAANAAIPDDFRVSITNADGDAAYPIASFTWILLYENNDDHARAQAMVELMKWALTAGQKQIGELGYAPLPQAVVDKEMAALGRIH
ncbi:MAG: phosphate ABC transporter substrate-binding protein PstS [Acidobacteria bacterium]|nr:MAG: phosphate ABC transporter substrate-binding protein PstS [Acidobacteriota bacterium]